MRAIGTLAMAGLTVRIATIGPEPGAIAAVAATGLVCECLDGVDGWLARRLGQTTPYGARFDMEVDAAMMLVLSTAVLAAGIAGPWVLAIGGWRYGYILAAQWIPALRQPLAPRFSRKVVAVAAALAQLAALLLSLTAAPRLVATIVLVLALVALSWSFIRDMVAQWRDHRRAQESGGPC